MLDPHAPLFNQSITSTLSITPTEQLIRSFPPAAGSATRICLVTSAISGPTLNGGIATAFYSLAQHLALRTDGRSDKRLFKVTVLYAAHPYYSVGTDQDWVDKFAREGIDFVPLPEPPIEFDGPKYVIRAYRIFEWLRDRETDFDVISYHDNMGNGYYVALAKHQQLHFRNTFLFVQCHSTVRWADMLNFRPPKDHNTLAYYYMEQKSIEYADARVSPSQYFLRWMQDEGRYDLSHGLSIVLPNTLFPLRPDNQATRTCSSSHFVFFARLEVRKGLLLFLDAIELLIAAGHAPTRVTFIGPNVGIDGVPAADVVRTRTRGGQWPLAVDFEHNFNTDRALRFLADSRAVTVLPTMGDNSPYAVMEVAAANLPLITSDAGGGHELLRDDPRDSVIFPSGNASALAAVMLRAMGPGIPTVALRLSFAATRDTYAQLIRSFHSLAARHPAPNYKALFQPDRRVTIGVTTHNRADQLLDCIRSVASQDYPHNLLHVVIVDDASTDADVPDALAKCERMLLERGISFEIKRLPTHSFVAATRNGIFSQALTRGDDYVCLMVCCSPTLLPFSSTAGRTTMTWRWRT